MYISIIVTEISHYVVLFPGNFLTKTTKIKINNIALIAIIVGTICGPTPSYSNPVSQGKNILPTLPPTRNIDVVLPVRRIRFSANATIVGKSGAAKKAVPAMEIHRAVVESCQSNKTRMLTMQPTRSIVSTCRGRSLKAIGMLNKRPRVNTPQKSEFA